MGETTLILSGNALFVFIHFGMIHILVAVSDMLADQAIVSIWYCTCHMLSLTETLIEVRKLICPRLLANNQAISDTKKRRIKKELLP